MNAQTLLRPCAVVLLSSLTFAGVLRVAPTGPYTTLQAAIDAAVDGDTILIEPNAYPLGFTIHDKALFLSVDPAGTASCGAAVVENLSASKNVVLDSLSITAASGIGLKVRTNAGSVRIQNCTLRGASSVVGVPSIVLGTGTFISGSTDVVMRGCTVYGGSGYSDWGASSGTDGMFVRGSQIALYHCSVYGGGGGYADPDSSHSGGYGGDGLETPDSFVLAQQSSFQGGHGGDGGDGDFLTPAGNGGAGGHGVHLRAESAGGIPPRFVNRQSTLLGGTGGIGGFWGGAWGTNGSPSFVAIGSVTVPAQLDCLKVSTPTSWPVGTMVPITIDGPAGASVSLYVAPDTSFVHNATTDYSLHIPAQFLRRITHVAIPASGTITLNVNVPTLPVGITTLPWYLQAVMTPIGASPTSSLACAVEF